MSVQFFPTYEQVLRSKFGRLIVDVEEFGADPTGVQESTDCYLAAAYAAQKGGGGTVWSGPGVFTAQGLPLYSNVRYVGAGRGATTLQLPVGATEHLFHQVVPAGGSLTNAVVSDMTLSANGNTGYLYGALLDASASSDIVEEDNIFGRLAFLGFAVGWYHGGNNSGAGPQNYKKTYVDNCSFYKCQFGIGHHGTYGDTYTKIFTSACTQAGISSYGAPLSLLSGSWGGPTVGSGPTTVLAIHTVHVEGLGNYASGTDAGILLAASAVNASGMEISYTSLNAFTLSNREAGIPCNVRGITSYGCGGGISLWCSTIAGMAGTVEGIELSNVGMNSGNWPVGYAERQYPISVETGAWRLSSGIVGYGSTVPAYNVFAGSGAGDLGSLDIEGITFPAAGTAFLAKGDTSAAIRISNCPGYNPVGPVTVAVPASGTATAALPYDSTFYITQATAASSVAVQGQTIAIPVGGPTAIRVPAGQTLTPTYTTAPTWVVMGD